MQYLDGASFKLLGARDSVGSKPDCYQFRKRSYAGIAAIWSRRFLDSAESGLLLSRRKLPIGRRSRSRATIPGQHEPRRIQSTDQLEAAFTATGSGKTFVAETSFHVRSRTRSSGVLRLGRNTHDYALGSVALGNHQRDVSRRRQESMVRRAALTLVVYAINGNGSRRARLGRTR